MKKIICLFLFAVIILCSCDDLYIYPNNGIKQNNNVVYVSKSVEEPKEKEFVINKDSFKFHKPTCYSVEIMCEYNKEYVVSTADKLIEMGYSPCLNCKPRKY